MVRRLELVPRSMRFMKSRLHDATIAHDGLVAAGDANEVASELDGRMGGAGGFAHIDCSHEAAHFNAVCVHKTSAVLLPVKLPTAATCQFPPGCVPKSMLPAQCPFEMSHSSVSPVDGL